jgi:hypothetical protein
MRMEQEIKSKGKGEKEKVMESDGNTHLGR